jgi:hypothetical protein
VTTLARNDLSQTLAQVRRLAVRRASLSAAYWLGLGILVVCLIATAHPQYSESLVGAILIIAASWFPALLWIQKKMGGFPIFPVFALTYTWTFGLPLIYEHPIVTLFRADDQLFAAFSVTGFLLMATVVWYFVRQQRTKIPRRCFAMRERGADIIFLSVLLVSIGFTAAVNGGWLNVSSGIYSIFRSIILALQGLACFALSYRLGRGELRGPKKVIFKVLMATVVIVSLPPLLMINSMSLVALAAFGYVSGSGKVPWISFTAAIAAFGLLQLGKAEMRDHYWGDADQGPVQPMEYPAFFKEWLSTSFDQLSAPVSRDEDEKHSLLERASLMQLLLYEQTLSSTVPFMSGETYMIVPQLLIPRIFYPERAATHEGTYRLNIHYGFQTREQTETTTLGFGLLNEAYANFGLAGMAMLAIALGGFYGWIERWAAVVPLLSARGLFAITVASFSFQTEFAAGVYAAALLQATCGVLLLSVFTMQKRANTSAAGTQMPSAVPP